MIAEVLSTGDEVRSGSIADTNASHIARELERVGFFVSRHGCVGDDEPLLCEVLKEISGRADIAVVTGGLGPTSDDITALAVAHAAGVSLLENDSALNMIETYFQSRNRSINPSNRKMAFLPEGVEILKNDAGTAPGFVLKLNQCVFYFLPGVPREMEIMLANEVLPRVIRVKDKTLRVYPMKNVTTFGLPESEVNERMKSFSQAFPELILGFRATFPEIHIKIYGRSENENTLNLQMESAVKWVAEKMGDYVLSLNGESMEEVVGRLLLEKKATLALAESCTGGLIASRMTDVAGSSRYFLFSGVTYSNDAKEKVLGVSPETLQKYGAVHEETAREMALGAKRVAGATYGLSTSGIAGPDGGTPEKPVGTVCIGLATPEASKGLRFQFSGGERLRNKTLFAIKALDLLRRELMGNRQ
jgi:nicotinamide-nucleotide amidase